MPVVHLVRHGHVHNPERVLYGRLPEFRLSDTGQLMAHTTARALADSGRDIGRLISSPLLRAQQTAAAIGAALDLPVETDDRLIEAGNIWEGKRIRPIARLALDPRTLWRIRNPWRPSWGEPYSDQRDRVTAAVLSAAASEPNRDSVLVSHQLPIWVTRLSAEDRKLAHNPSSRQCALASVTSLTVENGAIVGVEYSDPAATIPVPR
jgi:broad specificity phosphatase PhoE